MRTPSRPLRFAAALVALGLTAAACGSSDDEADADPAAVATSPAPEPTTGDTDASTEAPGDDTTQAPGDTAAPATSDSPAPGEVVAVPAALQFTAPLVGGGEFDGATVADKPTLFWFWAPT
jgi:hypothetical protein